MRERSPELRAFVDLARAAQGRHEVRVLMDRICTSVCETLGFDRASISRYLSETDEIEQVASRGVADDATIGRVRLDDLPLFRRALETERPVWIEDVRLEPALPADLVDRYGVGSVVTVPLVAGGRCLGFLSADRAGARFRLDDGSLDLLSALGTVTAVFLDHALETEEFRRVDEVKGQFIALASHELRTPAAVIHGIAQTLHMRGDDLRGDQLHQLRRTLHEQTDRMRRLVDQLLDLSRLEAEAIRIDPAPLWVRPRIEEIVLSVAGERAGDVGIDVRPELEAVVDANAFDRIVSNLVVNAFRYGDVPICVSAEQRDRHFRVAVEDRGSGVAPDFVPRLFERFTRSESAARAAGGAGLGLSIAKAYAHAHGGDLLYTDAAPRGARFELVLPQRAGA